KLCLMALALRIPCPGCGMTRATLALLHGDVARAFAIHPLSPIVAPLAVGWMVTQATGFVRTGSTFGTVRVPRSIELIAAVLLILLCGVWLARFFGFFGGPVSLR